MTLFRFYQNTNTPRLGMSAVYGKAEQNGTADQHPAYGRKIAGPDKTKQLTNELVGKPKVSSHRPLGIAFPWR